VLQSDLSNIYSSTMYSKQQDFSWHGIFFKENVKIIFNVIGFL
jgi:hypothetical protein